MSLAASIYYATNPTTFVFKPPTILLNRSSLNVYGQFFSGHRPEWGALETGVPICHWGTGGRVKVWCPSPNLCFGYGPASMALLWFKHREIPILPQFDDGKRNIFTFSPKISIFHKKYR